MTWKQVVLASVAIVAITVAFIIKTEIGGVIAGLTGVLTVILVKKARRNNG